MEKNELFYKLALSKVEGIGPVKYRKIMEQCETASSVFSMKIRQLKHIAGLGEVHARAILHFNRFNEIEDELKYIEKNNIRVLTFEDEDYPSRLKQCIDAPSILFFNGNANLNHPRILSIIGTRLCTEYGKRICEELIDDLKEFDILISSGLAFGIDSIAHRASLRNHIPTIGVVAHGLQTMYPAANRALSNEMINQGGILSEYFSTSKADKCNFPTRNRIVAGMSDATIIIETDIKGGSMITAETAYSYNRDIFCFPGRATDQKSAGCLHLIKSLKAQLVTNANDIAYALGWNRLKHPPVIQRQLFIELPTNEQAVLDILQTNSSLHIDEFYQRTSMNSSELAGVLLSLEMQQLIQIQPGKMVCLIQ